MKNLRFSTRLGIGFSIIILLSLITVGLSFTQINEISKDVEQMYQHPLVVSNTVKEIDKNINAIHRTMKDVVLSENSEEMTRYVELVNHYDSLILQEFKIIEERFLGNSSDVSEAYRSYNDWEIIRNKVINLTSEGQREEAVNITKSSGNKQVNIIHSKTQVVLEFAENKADEIYDSHLKAINNSTIILLIVAFILLALSIIISAIVSKSISKPIKKFITDIVSIFTTEQTLIEDLKTKSEEDILMFTTIELKNTYKALEDVNTELISNIEDKAQRTAELSIAKFQNEEKEKRVKELLLANQEKKTQADELVIVNKELLTTNATKDKFFSIIAHDLKSPFNSIIGFSSLLKEQVRKKNYEAIDKYASIIEQSSNRAMDLLINLMEWAKSQTGRMEFNPEYIDLEGLVNETIILYDDIAKQKNISFNTRKLLASQVFFADKAMITTVLRNLFSNAIKFTHTGGEIIISTETNQGQLTVTVKDNGTGISNENIQKIFRIDGNYTTIGTNKEKGTGLGLILCKEFIEKHKGVIWAESKEGKGTSISFTLPDEVAEGEDQMQITSSNEDANKYKKQAIPGLKILIAEDDDTSQQLISIIVEDFSKEMILVQTGAEALEACRNHHDIDLILMDINMPEMSGLEATKHIRTFNKEVIIIAQTAYSRSSDKDRALEAGCNNYISKPINTDKLTELIHSYFKR